MNDTSSIKLTGCLDIVLTDALGNIKEKRHVPNTVVTGGKELIAERLVTQSISIGHMTHMALGSSNSSPANAGAVDIVLVGTRQTLTPSRSGAIITYQCTFGPTVSTGTIQEAGIFNAATGGTMLCRTVFGTITKGASDTLAISWTVTIN